MKDEILRKTNIGEAPGSLLSSATGGLSKHLGSGLVAPSPPLFLVHRHVLVARGKA